MAQPHILIVGAGSVGKRHLRNFAGLGCEASVCEPRADRRAEAAEAAPLAHSYADFEAALRDAGRFSGVVICSPPKFHVDQALAALELGLPVFLEKPVSPAAASAARLAEALKTSRVPLLLGYTYRWWPPVQELRRRLEAGRVGRVLHVRCVMSAHLADWHPWERYQDFFMASRDLGGGALLDESHMLDLMLWCFGMPEAVQARVERLSALEIETDDTVDALLVYASGLRVNIHLDLYGRPHERSITVVGEDGTLQWSYERNALRRGQGPSEWEDTPYTCERNEMFLGAAREFLELLGGGRRAPSCTAQDGSEVLQVIEAMRESAASGRMIEMAARC